MEKKCNICNVIKSIDSYNRSSQHKSGFRNYCKDCQKNINNRYSERLGDVLKSRKKEWKLNNQEKVKISQIKDYQTNGKKRNKEKYNKIKSNPVEYLKILMRRRIRGILKTKNLNKKLSTKDIVGCEYSELKLYLEERFTEGMSWDNQGCWHIDHKTPLSSAKNEEEIYKLCHYTNLQPLWAIDNLRKGNKQ
jgi:transposase-like protein